MKKLRYQNSDCRLEHSVGSAVGIGKLYVQAQEGSGAARLAGLQALGRWTSANGKAARQYHHVAWESNGVYTAPGKVGRAGVGRAAMQVVREGIQYMAGSIDQVAGAGDGCSFTISRPRCDVLCCVVHAGTT